MYESLVMQQIDDHQPITLDAIESDLKNDCWDALYFATEEQISELIKADRIDEDFFSRHQNYLEEMRILVAEGQQEFSQ